MYTPDGERYATDTHHVQRDTHDVRVLQRLTVAEAAARLGITQDAVRQRIRRDTIRHEKDESGRVYVYLDSTDTAHDSVHDGPHDGVQDSVHAARAEELRDRVRFLEAELERKDAILMTMAQKMPELEAPSEPTGSPVSADEGAESSTAPPEQEKPLSWWRRFFGL